ncbi:hypothetical protein MRB53_023783 [Persea americana]|uniref:Uncharacterized protein n=1 Tax=Persea americana TaxID=3435 RepID=A0ACC2LAW3_PERAE|nr:hypothetical protein MRB53_023783 [Persea americana]
MCHIHQSQPHHHLLLLPCNTPPSTWKKNNSSPQKKIHVQIRSNSRKIFSSPSPAPSPTSSTTSAASRSVPATSPLPASTRATTPSLSSPASAAATSSSGPSPRTSPPSSLMTPTTLGILENPKGLKEWVFFPFPLPHHHRCRGELGIERCRGKMVQTRISSISRVVVKMGVTPIDCYPNPCQDRSIEREQRGREEEEEEEKRKMKVEEGGRKREAGLVVAVGACRLVSFQAGSGGSGG